MVGQNPYLDSRDVRLPVRPYRITFLPMRMTVTVEPGRIPYGTHGRPGSLLDVALAHGIAIDHACGGLCACATCHVWVREGLESLNPSTDNEEDMLDNAPNLSSSSRLACQAVPDGSRDVVVEIPAWNRNLATEG